MSFDIFCVTCGEKVDRSTCYGGKYGIFCESCARQKTDCDMCSSTCKIKDVTVAKHNGSIVQMCKKCFHIASLGTYDAFYIPRDYDCIDEYHCRKSERCELLFANSDDRSVRFGIEIEYRLKDNVSNLKRKLMARYIKRACPKNFLFVEEDSSIGFGFEIITAPMSLNYYLSDGREHMRKIIDFLIDNDAVSRSNCGMHVHVANNRIGSGRKTWTYVLAYLCSKHYRELRIRCGRSEAEISRWASRHPFPVDVESIDDFYKYVLISKYHIVNLSPYETVEFRGFRAPSSFDDFEDKLGLLLNLVAFSAFACDEDILGTKSIAEIEGFCGISLPFIPDDIHSLLSGESIQGQECASPCSETTCHANAPERP